MKDLTEMSEEELADFMLANPDDDSEVGKEAKIRRNCRVRTSPHSDILP